MLTLGSLFDGIGGWQLAAVHAGVKPIWSSEIEKFPLAVTRKRFPDTKQLGDVTKITDVEPVDIVCAGSPCQDLSIAGKREGLAGERSGLFINAINIVRQMRMSTAGKQPRFFIWENVPGAFTSGSERGADFRAVLESIAETDIPMPKDGRWANAGMVQCPKCEIAWRVLDAQYWGVPQRRRRIFLVADFATEKRCAAEVLFVEQSVPGDTAESSTARKEVAAVAGDGAEVSSWCRAGNIINRIVESEKSSTLAARDYKSARRFVEYSKPELASGKSCTGTLMANASTKLWSGDQEAFSGNYFVIDKQQEVPLYDISHRNDGVREIPRGACNTLVARMGTGGGNVAVLNEADRQKTDDAQTVRRLTVTECERLQGLPDGYTDVSVNGKPASERDRLMALGNGMAQPCADYVIQRIVDEVGKT